MTTEPSTGSMRIAFLTMLITCFFISLMYEATLTSFVAVHKIAMPFEGYEQLYLQSDYKVATVSGSSYSHLLRTGNDIQRKIYKERLILVEDVESGLQKALVENTAFIWSTPRVYDLVGQSCSHAQIKKPFYISALSWAVPKDFPYTEFINF